MQRMFTGQTKRVRVRFWRTATGFDTPTDNEVEKVDPTHGAVASQVLTRETPAYA